MAGQNKLLKSLFGSKLVAPLGGKRLKREVRASANLRYGSELRDIKKERRISRAQQKRSADWFQDYQNKLGEIQGQNEGAYAAAGQQIGQNAEASADRSASRIQGMEADRAATSNTFGLRADPTAGNTMAAASQVRSGQAANAQSRLGAQGLAQFSYLGSQKQAGHQEALRTKMGEVDRRGALRQQTRDVKKEKGQFKQDIRRELRGGERQFLSDLLSSKLGKKTLAETVRSNKENEEQGRTALDIRKEEAAAEKESQKEAKRIRQKSFNSMESYARSEAKDQEGKNWGKSPHSIVKNNMESIVIGLADKHDISNPKAKELVKRWLAKASKKGYGGVDDGSGDKPGGDLGGLAPPSGDKPYDGPTGGGKFYG